MVRTAAIGWRGVSIIVLVWGLAMAGCAGLETAGPTVTDVREAAGEGTGVAGGGDGVVTGRLITEVGQYPVAGARVKIGGMETTTGNSGVFWISNVAVGAHRLEVAADGHVLFEEFAHVQVIAGTNDLGDIELIAVSDIPGTVPPAPPRL